MDIRFVTYLEQRITHMVWHGDIITIINANNYMVMSGINTTLGYIYTDYNGKYIKKYNDKKKYYIRDNNIRDFFNKDEYIKALLVDNDLFEMSKHIFYSEYKETVLHEVCTSDIGDFMKKEQG